MNKLQQEDLKFIENYLINNQVKFIDIRSEMHDHIATAVEEKMNQEDLDFYDAFKEYMIKNKKDLMNMNKETSLNFSFSTFSEFLKFLTKPISLFALSCIVFIYFFLIDNFELSTSELKSKLMLINLLIMLIVGIFFYFLHQKTKVRIYKLEKNFSFIFLFYYVLNPFFQFYNDLKFIYLFSITYIYLYVCFFIFLFIETKKYLTQKIYETDTLTN
jgi:hypothetical protein